MGSKFKGEHGAALAGLLANDRHLLGLVNNQTTIIEKTMNILKRDEKELILQSERLKNITVQIEKTMDYYAATAFFSDAVAYLLQGMIEFEKQMEILLQVIYDGYRQHINHVLLPPKQLAEEIREVSAQIRNKFLVPVGNDIYSIISVKPHISDNRVLFHISMPLLRLNTYKLFRIIPVPFVYNNASWVIDAKHNFIMVSGDQDSYQFLSQIDKNKCRKYDNSLICNGPFYWHTSAVPQCEWNVFNQISHNDCVLKRETRGSVWYDIGENKWIFSCGRQQDLTFICTDQMYHEKIDGSGILQFNQNCSIRSSSIEINGKKGFNGKKLEILVPNIRSIGTHRIDLSSVMHSANLTLSDFDELSESIANMKKNARLPNGVKFKDVHDYTVIYLTLFMVLRSI